MMFKYKINIDKKIIAILGPHLYGDTATIIAELVANSYDADADNCWVTIKTGDKPKVIIEDDGNGMTPTQVNKYFLNIGFDRRDKRPRTKKGRRVFGRKGIGKLAAFSLAKRIELYSMKNNEKAGCLLDYDRITKNNENPSAIPDKDVSFKKSRLSKKGTGTRLVLRDIQKNINNTYYYLVNRLVRNFCIDFDKFQIHLQKNDEQPMKVDYKELDYFKVMDTIVTIGNETKDKGLLVKNNNIIDRYKSITEYKDLFNVDEGKKSRFMKIPSKISVFDKEGKQKQIDFTFYGWIGTITSKEKLRGLVIKGNAKKAEKDSISINDNRISLFSRDRIGEYDVLPMVQTDTVYDAYIIGEFHVNLFEDDKIVDMAISNRRGYEETDERYRTLMGFLKPLVRYITQRKAAIQKLKKDDEDLKEAREIKRGFLAKEKTRELLEEKLTRDELNIVQDDHYQFSRATQKGRKTKQIFISHNGEHKQYGFFIMRMFQLLKVNIKDVFLFTSDINTGVPLDENIYRYLKDAFRDDLYVIFLFSRYFYDSNVCIAETGAAWATNRKHCNIVIDIKYGDIDKPIDNAQQSMKIGKIKDLDKIAVSMMIKNALTQIEHKIPSDAKIMEAIDQTCIEFKGKLKAQPFYPGRKYQGHPTCSKKNCGAVMNIVRNGKEINYECSTPNCHKKIPATIR